MATNHPSSSTPIRPTEILDPHPERLTRLVGVRRTTHLTAVPDRIEQQISATATHTSFAASSHPLITQRRRFAAPIASTILTILGQGILGALMASRTVDPALGMTVFIGWLVCGLTLIVAQCVQLAGERQ